MWVPVTVDMLAGIVSQDVQPPVFATSKMATGVSGAVEVVLDSPTNSPVATFDVANTGGWTSWETIPANMSKVTGTHNVYLEFDSGASGDPPFVSLHYFNFPVS